MKASFRASLSLGFLISEIRNSKVGDLKSCKKLLWSFIYSQSKSTGLKVGTTSKQLPAPTKRTGREIFKKRTNKIQNFV